MGKRGADARHAGDTRWSFLRLINLDKNIFMAISQDGALKHPVAQEQPTFVNRHDHLKDWSELGSMRVLSPVSAETAAGLGPAVGLGGGKGSAAANRGAPRAARHGPRGRRSVSVSARHTVPQWYTCARARTHVHAIRNIDYKFPGK